MKKSCLILLPILLSGCFMHVRDCSTSLEPAYVKAEQIATKHKYRLAKPLASVEKDLAKLNVLLACCQPDVFALDGIPIEVREHQLARKDSAGQFSGGEYLISFFTLSLVPLHMTAFEGSYSYKLAISEGDVESFIVKNRKETCNSYFPTAYFMSSLVWDSMEGECEDERNCSFGFLMGECMAYPRKSFAYALATRLKELEDSGVDIAKAFAVKPVPPYSVGAWRKDGNRHDFAISLIDGTVRMNEETLRLIKEDFARKIIDGYLSEHPSVNPDSLKVAFLKYGVVKGRVVGSAEIIAMRLELESSYYDSYTRKGKIAFRVRKSQYETARNWARQHIAEIARDKNIRLVGDEIPKTASFYLGDEKYENGILEMEYTVE